MWKSVAVATAVAVGAFAAAATAADQIQVKGDEPGTFSLAPAGTITKTHAPRPPYGDGVEAQPESTRAHQRAIGSCTMAVPPVRAAVEVEIANAADFCELASHGLAGDVFRAPVIVTPGRLWHYADAGLSCRLRYGHTRYRMTIHNSGAVCRWLARLTTGWHREPAPSAYASRGSPQADRETSERGATRRIFVPKSREGGRP